MQCLHHAILNIVPSRKVDHKNGNGLDNQRENLRSVTNAENLRGFYRLQSRNTSGFRGVVWYKPQSKWLSQICHNGQRMHIGYYADTVEAALARDAKARELGWPEEGMNFPLEFSKQQPILKEQ